MKKLIFKNVRDNINGHLKLNGLDTFNLDADHFNCIIMGLVDSINESIGESWEGKTARYEGQQLQVHEIFTGNKCKFINMQKFKCTKDYGADVTIMDGDNTFNVPKEWMKLK
jgi:hypothetical protein